MFNSGSEKFGGVPDFLDLPWGICGLMELRVREFSGRRHGRASPLVLPLPFFWIDHGGRHASFAPVGYSGRTVSAGGGLCHSGHVDKTLPPPFPPSAAKRRRSPPPPIRGRPIQPGRRESSRRPVYFSRPVSGGARFRGCRRRRVPPPGDRVCCPAMPRPKSFSARWGRSP